MICLVAALKPLEDAESNRKHPVVLHKLPVVSGHTAEVVDPSVERRRITTKDPPRKATVLILPPRVRAELPIIAKNVNHLTPQDIAHQNQQQHILLPKGGARMKQSEAQPSASGGNKQHVMANAELLELYRTGILPGRWQILTKSGQSTNSQNRPRRR